MRSCLRSVKRLRRMPTEFSTHLEPTDGAYIYCGISAEAGSSSLNTHKVVPAGGSIISGVRLRLPASKAPPPPATTTTYCTPSTLNIAGEELGEAFKPTCHSTLPVAASYARKR